MKIIIRENQIGKLYPVLRKYWDKSPYPTYNSRAPRLFGLNYKYESEFIGMFMDYLGTDEVIERLDKIVNPYSTWTPNDECGTYDFEYVIRTYEIDYDDYEVTLYVNCKGDGRVTIDGEEMSIMDALNNHDYGWEVEQEIKECILYDVIYNKIKSETGLDSRIQFI